MVFLKKLSELLRKYPVKTIMVAVIAVVLLAVGIGNVSMATGNDTLVKSDTDVYQDNLDLETEFGGEALMVLYEADNLLTPEHLAHMKGIENELRTNDSIYTMISPVTLVEEMAKKQSNMFQEGISDVIEGLGTMGSELISISGSLGENLQRDQEMDFPELGDFTIPETEDPVLPEMGETQFPKLGGLELPELKEMELPELKLPEFGDIQVPDINGGMADLNQAFSNMVAAQEGLSKGTVYLIGGYDQFSQQLNQVEGSLLSLTDGMQESPEKGQLEEVGKKLSGLSKQMAQISEDSGQLPAIPDQTITGLNNIQEKLQEQTAEQQALLKEQEKLEEKIQLEMKQIQEDLKQKMGSQQDAQQEEIKEEMVKQQVVLEDKMKVEMQNQQEAQEEEIKREMQVQQDIQKDDMQVQMEGQLTEKESQMEEFKKQMEQERAEQMDQLRTLAGGLAKMGENLQSISENMKNIETYSDIMSPGLPTEQATLDNMIYDEEDNLRVMFEEVVIDDNHMMMMIKFNGDTDDATKSDVVNTINTYLETEAIDSVETIVTGKPVLDNSIRSSMQESIQQMMGLALVIMIVVLFLVFKVRWRILPLVTVLIAVVGTVGLMGWMNIPITMVSMAVFPILIGLGIDYAIQFQTRYTEELAKEDLNE